LFRQQKRCFTAALDGLNERVSAMKSSYPNLFNKSSFLSDQESLLSSYRSSLSGLLSEYDSACKAIEQSTGEPVFMTLDESTLLQQLETRNKPMFESLTASENWDDLGLKLTEGKEYVDRIMSLQAEQEAASTVEEANLKMLEIANVGDKLDEWQLRFPDPTTDSTALGLPISDEEVDEWVKLQYHHAPDEVREQGRISYDEHKKVEEDWMKTLDDKLVDVLKSRDSNFDEAHFRAFCEMTNEMFHPHSIDHYGMSNYAKALFRAALWQSKDRCSVVEASVELLANLLEDGVDDDPTIMRGVYETSPDTRYAQLAAHQLKITDPLFAAKLIQEIRLKLESVAISRAQKDTINPLQVPYLQAERSELETELSESLSSNPANMKRGIEVLSAEEETFRMEVPSLDALLDEMLPSKLWGNDISKVKAAIMSYASGGSLSSVESAIEETLKPSCTADIGGVTDSEILDLSVKYHNSKYSKIENFNFKQFLTNCAAKKDMATMLSNQRAVKKQLDGMGCDPLVVNMVRILVEDGATTGLEKICNDYLDIMKRFRGEVEGFVTSAEELDEATFGQIKSAIEAANPGKKITLERVVDSGLQSGFIVKAGVQRFDFSMATVIHQGRTAVGTI